MFKLGKKIILVILVSTLLIYQPILINADENSVSFERETINPGSFYYPLKRLWEKGREKMIFSKEEKINYNFLLLKTRLSELNYVVENKLLSDVQKSSERLAYQTGILTEELISQNKYKEKFIKEFQLYIPFLDKLRDKYPANSSFWMLVQHDINTLIIQSENLTK